MFPGQCEVIRYAENASWCPFIALTLLVRCLPCGRTVPLDGWKFVAFLTPPIVIAFAIFVSVCVSGGIALILTIVLLAAGVGYYYLQQRYGWADSGGRVRLGSTSLPQDAHALSRSLVGDEAGVEMVDAQPASPRTDAAQTDKSSLRQQRQPRGGNHRRKGVASGGSQYVSMPSDEDEGSEAHAGGQGVPGVAATNT